MSPLAGLFEPKVEQRGPDAGLVTSGNVSSKYGVRQLPGEPSKMHEGIDVAAPRGAEVRAAAVGTVADVSPNGERTGYGNVVIVEHPSGRMTLYAHLDHFAKGIKVGTPVQAGTVLGYVGSTSAPNPEPVAHLHFEVIAGPKELWQGRIVVNPHVERLEPQAWLRKNDRPVSDVA